MRPSRAVVVAVIALAAACRPDFDERPSRIDRPTVLAVRIEPAEARPGDVVSAAVFVATPDGPLERPTTDFGFCTTPKLLTENGAVSEACQRGEVAPIGAAPGAASAPLPDDACFSFGPETSAAELRPRDPDATGGFYQPIRAVTAGAVAFGFARLRCNLANAPAEVVARYAAEYRVNVNPTLLPLEARVGGAVVAWDGIPAGARVAVRASWRPEDAERYVAFDAAAQTLVARRESMRVSWASTAGGFDADRTGASETDPSTSTENVWTAPAEASLRVHLFAVLRDARGGVAFTTVAITTR